YHVWGDGAAPAMVMLHGFQDHGKSYARTAAALADRWRVIAPDLRGHGESEWVGAGGDYHFYDYFFDVMTLVDQLALDRFVLAGHSMGGNVAVGVASLMSRRITRLVLLEGMGFVTHDLSDSVHRLVRWSTALKRDGIDLDRDARRRARPVMRDLE